MGDSLGNNDMVEGIFNPLSMTFGCYPSFSCLLIDDNFILLLPQSLAFVSNSPSKSIGFYKFFANLEQIQFYFCIFAASITKTI
jgi:hypothetical protein